jgi:hypothetical protein
MRRGRLTNRSDIRVTERLLRALAQPKKGLVISIVNSGLFLWILTAVFLTTGGSYISNRQACSTEADQIIDKRNRLALEMEKRRSAIAQGIAEARTVDEVRDILKSPPNIFPDLKNRTLLELSSEYVNLNENIDETAVRSLEIALARKIEPMTTTQFMRYRSLYIGELGKTDYDLADLKDFSRKYFEGDRIRSLVHKLSEFKPDCSVRTVLDRILNGSRAVHVTQEPLMDSAVVEALYNNPDFAGFDIIRTPALRPPFVKIEDKKLH